MLQDLHIPRNELSLRARPSMSLEGKAEVTTRTGDALSSPHSQPTPTAINPVRLSNSELQCSYSALEPGNEVFSKRAFSEIVPVPYTTRAMIGRSRDARTWEFYCDSDACNVLIEQAEREEKGSATTAIGLISKNEQCKF